MRRMPSQASATKMRTTSRVEHVRLLLMAERHALHYKDGQTVSRWETGAHMPANLDAVAAALKWTLAEMVAGI